MGEHTRERERGGGGERGRKETKKNFGQKNLKERNHWERPMHR
jgi:hypothetical protein